MAMLASRAKHQYSFFLHIAPGFTLLRPRGKTLSISSRFENSW